LWMTSSRAARPYSPRSSSRAECSDSALHSVSDAAVLAVSASKRFSPLGTMQYAAWGAHSPRVTAPETEWRWSHSPTESSQTCMPPYFRACLLTHAHTNTHTLSLASSPVDDRHPVCVCSACTGRKSGYKTGRHVQAQARARAHTHTHTHTHDKIHTHTHAHTRTHTHTHRWKKWMQN
jgi:hypothetical protein